MFALIATNHSPFVQLIADGLIKTTETTMFADLPTLTVWGINSRSHDLASKSHGESENLEIAKQFG